MITSAQIRAARAALRWSVQMLATNSGVGLRTLIRFEQSDGIPPSRSETLREVQKCLERAGIEFTGTPDEWPGVRFPANLELAEKPELLDDRGAKKSAKTTPDR